MNRTLYINGEIITMDPACFQPEAVLVEEGVVKQLGRKESLLKRYPGARLFDLQGNVLAPAFLDSHSHLTMLATTLESVSLSDAGNFKEIVEKIRAFRRDRGLSDRDWICGFGYDHNFLEEKQHPTREILDQASLVNPIVISHASGHMGVMNSAALQAAGIGKDTPDPDGGVIGRTKGVPNGYLEEAAFTHYSSVLPAPSREQSRRRMAKAQRVYLEHGITTVQDGYTKKEQWELLKDMAESGELLVDTVCYLDLKDNRNIARENPAYFKSYHNRLKIGGYKIFLDGSPQGRTAWLSEPYENARDGYRGYGTYQNDQVRRFVRAALEDRTQLLAHCNGDAAANQLLDAWKAEAASFPQAAQFMRPVMIHAQLVRREQLKQMAKLGMIASFFVSHTYYWGDVHLRNLGPDRARRISPARSAMEEGVIYTFHQDSPVAPPDMLHTVWCAAVRATKNGAVLGEQERIPPLEALRGVTVNAAYQYFEEERKGSITPGKLADLVVLDRNPLTVAFNQIKEIEVLYTIKEDRVVYSKHSPFPANEGDVRAE